MESILNNLQYILIMLISRTKIVYAI